MAAVLWWVRRDLRLSDNQALASALKHGGPVIPVFVLDPTLLGSSFASPKRLSFLYDGLRKLDKSLRARGSYLTIRQGDPVDVLETLLDEHGADGIFAEEDFSPYALRRDEKVAEGLPLHLTSGLTIHVPWAVQKQDGTPYRVFTPFSRAWKSRSQPVPDDVIPAPDHISTPIESNNQASSILPTAPDSDSFIPGEYEAQRLLQAFGEGSSPPIYQYARDRNDLSIDGTSRLSPYLRFGMLSARQAAVAAFSAIEAAPNTQARKGAEAWLNELIWREFYISVLCHFPEVRRQRFRPALENIAWENDERSFTAWCEGRTGYPVVDAAMRQLINTGWMHNRARMIVASFLVKDLLTDWRWGERWFMQHLVDGDPAANSGGWQWVAGTGADAAPYFRVFNPILQGKKHDPKGNYVRHWIPELGHVPDKYIHKPWEMPEDVQETSHCIIGHNYPAPIVDHAWARERTLAAYAQAREGIE